MDKPNAKAVQQRPATSTNRNQPQRQAGVIAQSENEDVGIQSMQDRALLILSNNQLLLRYAVANNLVSSEFALVRTMYSERKT